MPPTMDMLSNIAHDLEMLELYEKAFEKNPNMGKVLVDIFVEVIDFWTTAIHFFRRNSSRKYCLVYLFHAKY